MGCLNIGEPQRGDIVLALGRFLSPFQGFRFLLVSNQGFTPLAIIFRPVGALESFGLGAGLVLRSSLPMVARMPTRTWAWHPGFVGSEFGKPEIGNPELGNPGSLIVRASLCWRPSTPKRTWGVAPGVGYGTRSWVRHPDSDTAPSNGRCTSQLGVTPWFGWPGESRGRSK